MRFYNQTADKCANLRKFLDLLGIDVRYANEHEFHRYIIIEIHNNFAKISPIEFAKKKNAVNEVVIV